jgi:hypothetical protein
MPPPDLARLADTALGALISAATAYLFTRVQDRRRRAEAIADRRDAVAGAALGLLAQMATACRGADAHHRCLRAIMDHGEALETAVEALASVVPAGADRLRSLATDLTELQRSDQSQNQPAAIATRAEALRQAIMAQAPQAVPAPLPSPWSGGIY